MRVLSLFSGIGAFEKALDNIGVKYELVNYCEIDKYASKSYSAIHGVDESMNLWDVTKVDGTKLAKDIDVLTYGFPCQDISLAGKQKGLFNEDNTLTRSGLFFEALRIIEETKPRVAIAENVKNLTGKKFKEQFKIVLDSLAEAGYANYWKVLNLKDFGIPQNRERVFIVSIRKDVDYPFFHFPVGHPLELRLRDILEEEVDEKYYIDESKIVANLPNCTELMTGFVSKQCSHFERKSDVANTLLARDYKGFGNQAMNCVVEPQLQQIGQIYPNSGNPQAGRIYDADGISPTMDTCSGGNRMPKVAVTEPVKINLKNGETITSDDDTSYLRIRKLTPRECFRLMGFDDEDFAKAEAVNSNTQLYKQAGNSIGVPVLEHIFKALLDCGVLTN